MIQKVDRLENVGIDRSELSIPDFDKLAHIEDVNIEGVVDAAGRVLGSELGEVVTKVTKDEIIVQITRG